MVFKGFSSVGSDLMGSQTLAGDWLVGFVWAGVGGLAGLRLVG